MEWKGLLGAEVTVSETYVYIVTLKNCYEEKTFNGTIDLLSHLESNVSENLPEPIQIDKIKSCCPDQLDIQNATINTQKSVSANFSINAAGFSIVTINTLDPVKFTAVNSIEFNPGFETFDSINFDAHCAICLETNLGKRNDSKNSKNKEIKLEEGIYIANKMNFNLFPNPTNSILNYEMNQDLSQGEFDFFIFDLLGHEIEFGKTNRNAGQLNIDKLNNGIYILKFSRENTNTILYGKFSKN